MDLFTTLFSISGYIFAKNYSFSLRLTTNDNIRKLSTTYFEYFEGVIIFDAFFFTGMIFPCFHWVIMSCWHIQYYASLIMSGKSEGDRRAIYTYGLKSTSYG